MAPQPGDFGLTTLDFIHGGFGIRLGEWLNGSKWRNYQHAFVVVDDDQIVEAAPGGAVLSTISQYAGQRMVFSSWDLTDAQRATICANARATLGTPYSAADYFALIAHRFHIPAPGLRNYVASSGHMICSQLVDHVYAESGLTIFDDGRWEGYVTPEDLEAALPGPVTA